MLPVMALTAVLGALEGLFLPPSYAILPDILERRRTAGRQRAQHCARERRRVRRPGPGRSRGRVFTPGVALAIDAATFVVSAATLLALRPTPRGAGAAAEGDGGSDRTRRTARPEWGS